ncbi:hypothetical protein V8F44DRAFT_390466 [Aspergillus fumigatus]
MRRDFFLIFFVFFFLLPWTQRDNGINPSEMRFEDKIRYTSPVATRKLSKENAENPDVGVVSPDILALKLSLHSSSSVITESSHERRRDVPLVNRNSI